MRQAISKNASMLRYVFKAQPLYVTTTLALALVGSLSAAVLNILIKYAIDVRDQQTLRAFFSLLLLVGCFEMVCLAFSALHTCLISPISLNHFQQKVSHKLWAQARDVELAYYDDPAFYDTYMLALENSDKRMLGVFNTFVSVFSNMASIVILASIIALVDPWLIAFSLASVLITSFLNLRISKLSYKINTSTVYQRRTISYVQRVHYLKDFAKELRTSGIHAVLINYFDRAIHQMNTVYRQEGKKIFALKALYSFVHVGTSLGMIMFLVIKLSRGEISPGSFAMLYNSANQLSSNINALLGIFPQFYEHSLYIDKFNEFMSLKKAHHACGNSLGSFHALTFQNVSYAYGPELTNAVQGIDIAIHKGEKVALVGLNGAGKSTFIKLMLGLYEPTKGSVHINGSPPRGYSTATLNQLYGIVYQDFQLFALPLIENILLRPVQNRATDEREVCDALAAVGLLDKVLALPNGIYSVFSKELSKEGVIFSGGEMQKLAVARTLVNSSELLVLDEPSSALDAFSEARIFETLLGQQGKTILVISHRLLNISNFDKIIYFDNGRVAEVGDHNELMLRRGKYYELFSLQSKAYRQLAEGPREENKNDSIL